MHYQPNVLTCVPNQTTDHHAGLTRPLPETVPSHIEQKQACWFSGYATSSRPIGAMLMLTPLFNHRP
jgi:hypothetical protein